MGKTFENFTDWDNCTATYRKFVSRDGVGKVTYASDVSLSCYIFGKTTLIRVEGAHEVISTQQLIIDGANVNVAGMTVDDAFVTDRQRNVLSLQPYYDEEGTLDFMVVFL